jgi:glycosyltransferase involved in cell wall biosynthesis
VLISVIIPCYNVEEYIEECIESVIKQTYKEIEIICIDNNSTDSTKDVLTKLKQKHTALIFEKEMTPGACAARNKGLSLAKGEWIQFLDADDLLLETKIEHQLKLIQGKSDGFIAGAWKKRLVNGNETDIVQFNPNIFSAVFTSQSGNTCSNLWKKENLIKIGGWNEALKSSQEADLMMRLALSNKLFLIDTVPLTIVRVRESGQISQLNVSDNLERFIEVRLSYLQELESMFPQVFLSIKNELYSYLLAFVIKLYKYFPEKALGIYNNKLKQKLQINLKYKKTTFIKLVGFKVVAQLSK